MKDSNKFLLAFIGLIAVFIIAGVVFKATMFMIAASLLGFAISAVLWLVKYIKTNYHKVPTPGKWYFIWWGIAFSLAILTIQLIMGILMAYIWFIVSIAIVAMLFVIFIPSKKTVKP